MMVQLTKIACMLILLTTVFASSNVSAINLERTVNEQNQGISKTLNGTRASGLSDFASDQMSGIQSFQLVDNNNEVNREGEWRYYISSSLFSFLYGFSLPMALGSDVPNATALFGVPLFGMGLNYYITRDMEITNGTANFSTLGAYYGIGTLILLGNAMADVNQQMVYISIVAGGLGGQIAGFSLANRWSYDRGQSRTLFHYGAYGAMFSTLIYSTIFSEFQQSSRSGSAVTLFGLTGGIFAGKNLADNNSYSDGAITIQSWAVLPIALSLSRATLTLIESDNFRTVGLTTILFSGAGLGLSSYVYRNADISRGEGALVSLGAWMGGALGATLADSQSPGSYFLIPIGGMAGFAMTHFIVSPFDNDQAGNSNSGFSYNFSPSVIPASQFIENTSGVIPAGHLSIKF